MKAKETYAISQLGPFPWVSSIRTRLYSYYKNNDNDNPSLLFDLTKDPQEQNNVLNLHPQEAARLKKQLDEVNASRAENVARPRRDSMDLNDY